MKLAILFGGSSNEHEVSVLSACSIVKNLDKNKYFITPIYLDKNNTFYLWNCDIEKIQNLEVGELPNNLEYIKEPFNFLKTFDSVFIMIHGKNGEDGTLASILDFLHVPYVGNSMASSVITMDKIYTKDILEANNIKTTKYVSFARYNKEFVFQGKIVSFNEVIKFIKQNISFPMFVKPANSGSSIGITKVLNERDLIIAIDEALKIDNRVLIEQMIIGRELECAILEHDGKVEASVIGEVIASDDFYTFDAKYKSKQSKTLIPANVSSISALNIQEVAIRAFKTLNLHGYSRIDFFLTTDNEVILNEINTIPGFTNISMYPKLWEASGINYTRLLDILINDVKNK